MNEGFFHELHKLGREDELRAKLLIRGVKRILDEKKEETGLKKLLRRRKKSRVQPSAWN
ncbi:hypothetical protein ACFOQM_09240 [Paenibacillus sp. GCM10012307]|uniref:Uncharacterized protein n=1 Tax=Paenibacillus roseus TaxID=2798579 RepID=A0A934MUV4_9BACL|nr:hypothetical protein [Paenibacillus roseus]MBJ6361467.1 hypothetical protein [Paenibacillus roseus]